MSKGYNMECDIARVLDVVGDKWVLLIVHNLLSGINKFNELRRALKGISPNMLSDRLRSLEEVGIVEKVMYSSKPLRYEYMLTRYGTDLRRVLNTCMLWGNDYFDETSDSIYHNECSHEVKIRYYCPSCDKDIQDLQFRHSGLR